MEYMHKYIFVKDTTWEKIVQDYAEVIENTIGTAIVKKYVKRERC